MNRYAYVLVRERSDLIVSGGLGCSIVPIRIGVPPEIVLATLGGGGEGGWTLNGSGPQATRATRPAAPLSKRRRV